MDDQSTTSKQKTLPGINEPTSSPESADGSTPCALPDGLKTERFGPAHVPASHFHKPEGAEDLKMTGIYGLFGTSLSRSASLQQSLENKLLHMMEEYGSIEYVLTWKRWDMPSGPPICALRASTPRTSDKDCGGWPTPNAMSRGAHKLNKDGERISGKGVRFGATLQSVAAIAGWTSPVAMDTVERRHMRPSREATGRKTDYLSEQVVGWGTPRANDGSLANTVRMPPSGEKSRLELQVLGTNTDGPLASTENPGALNPALCRWLMGYPAEWDEYAPTGTR